MKILFFTRRFWPSIGGVEKHVLMLSRELVMRGNQVTVVTEGPTFSSNSEDSAGEGGIKVHRIPVTTGERLKKFQIWGWLFKNKHLIQEADIIHCHDVFFWYLPFRFLYPKKKVFTTFHGWEGTYPPKWQAKLVRKISEKLSFGNICVGDFIKKWYGTKPDLVTYGGVSSKQQPGPARVENSKEKTAEPRILFIGRLEEDTGLPIYFQALEILGNEGAGVKIEFAGDGSLRKETEKYGEVLGFIEGLEESINNFDFVFTSGYLSILEAMAQKKLVFAVFDNPLKEDYLKMAPFSQWIVIKSEPKELEEKIMFFAKNPGEEKKLVEEGYNWAIKQSWEKLAEEYLTLWEK